MVERIDGGPCEHDLRIDMGSIWNSLTLPEQAEVFTRYVLRQPETASGILIEPYEKSKRVLWLLFQDNWFRMDDEKKRLFVEEALSYAVYISLKDTYGDNFLLTWEQLRTIVSCDNVVGTFDAWRYIYGQMPDRAQFENTVRDLWGQRIVALKREAILKAIERFGSYYRWIALVLLHLAHSLDSPHLLLLVAGLFTIGCGSHHMQKTEESDMVGCVSHDKV